MNEIKLLPCPFCGTPPGTDIENNGVGVYWIICDNGAEACGSEGPYRHSQDDARAAWNRRAALSSAAVAEREPVAFVSANAVRHHIDSGTSQTGTVLHREQGELYGEKHLALYLDPPPTSELEAENARLATLVEVAELCLRNQQQTADAIVAALEAERERLALAICGGEDAPGYANAQTVETLEQVARDNQLSHLRDIDHISALEAKLAERVKVKQLDNATQQKLREALRFAASRSVLSSEDERRILSALEAAPPATHANSASVEATPPAPPYSEGASKYNPDAHVIANTPPAPKVTAVEDTLSILRSVKRYAKQIGVEFTINEKRLAEFLAAELQRHPSPKVTAHLIHGDARESILSRIHVFSEMEPEEDEDWEDWYRAAFDMLASEVSSIFATLTAAQEAGKP